jgi:hypothetical protein
VYEWPVLLDHYSLPNRKITVLTKKQYNHPKVHQILVADACLDELFLTSHILLLGDSSFYTILDNEAPAVKMSLVSLYLNQETGQMFVRYHYNNRGNL